jgi:ABC-type transport system substrate-binding protein
MIGVTFRRVTCLAVAAVALPLLIACSGGTRDDAGSSAPATSGAGQASDAPVKPKVDRLVMGVAAPSLEANEPRMYGQPQAWQLRPMYEFLIGMDAATGKLVPQLATEWTLEPDGKSYRFKLRRGVQFHDGFGEFTAKDVVFSHAQVSKEDSIHGETVYWRTLVQKIEIIDDYELVFVNTRPDGNFIHGISEAESGMEIRSKAAYDKNGEPSSLAGKPLAGTGPYQFKERAQGQFIRFERTPYKHWRVAPDFPEFEYRFQAEASTRLAALLAGEVHLTNLPEDLLKDVEKREGYKIVRGKVAGARGFFTLDGVATPDGQPFAEPMRHPDSPLLDVRVRKALNKAINRDELNKAFFGGKGETQIQCHLHPTRPGWNPEWQAKFKDEYGYDPAAAKKLLADAGKSSLTTNLHVINLAAYSGSEDITEAVANYWRAIGVTVNLVTMDSVERAGLTRQWKFNNHWSIVGTSSAEFIGTFAYSSAFGPPGGMDLPSVNRLFAQIREEADTKKQEELWRKIGDEMFVQHMCLPLFWIPTEAVVNTKIVADYVFPGNISGTWATHPENLKAAK